MGEELKNIRLMKRSELDLEDGLTPEELDGIFQQADGGVYLVGEKIPGPERRFRAVSDIHPRANFLTEALPEFRDKYPDKHLDAYVMYDL